MNAKTLITLLFLFSISAHALEIDEKLTTRILSVSSSKKTVLLNRGLEDGLVVGDHAKFFLTTGVIARGVVSKASPSRSIWSLYRLISVDSITVGKVVNIKISSPLKLTDDHSKSLSFEPVVSGTDRISISKGDPRIRGGNDQAELDSLNDAPIVAGEERKTQAVYSRGAYIRNLDSKESSNAQGRGVFSNKSLELIGSFKWNSLSTSTDSGTTDSEITTGKSSTIEFGLALEKYFPHRRDWLRSFSFYGSIDYSSTSVSSGSSTTSDTTISSTKFGLGTNWHFLNDILSFGNPIGFISGSFGFLNGSTDDGTTSVKTGGTYFSIGVGGKYYIASGFGVRALIDYYSQGVKSSATDSDVESVTTLSGIRLGVGLSYLF